MRKIKSVAVFAAIGFVVSFVFGLFSKRGFGFILLTALIFALIFAVLGLVIDLLFNKVLLDDSDSEQTIDSSVNSTDNAEAKKGQIVDFTIQDEDLPQGTSSNHFVVNDKHQILNATDVFQNSNDSKNPNESSSDENAKAVNEGFTPLKKAETFDNISSKEAISPDSVQSNEQNVDFPENEDSNDIDMLPDLDNFNFETKSAEDVDSSNESYKDSDSSFSTSFTNSHRKTDDVGIQDAALMAKAISSALSNDES